MLAKLRRRFILIMMGLVGLVLLVVLALSVVSNYRTTSASIEAAIDQAVNRGPGDSQRPWVGRQGSSATGQGNLGAQGQAPEAASPGGQGTQPPPNEQGDPGNKELEAPPGGDPFTPVYVASIDAESFAVLSDNSDFVSIDEALVAEALAHVAKRLRQEGAATGDTLANGGENLRGLLFDSRLIYRVNVTADGSVTVALADATALLDGTLGQAGISVLIWLGAMVVFFFISLLLSKLALRPVGEAWERQRRFVADASHELKTPLTVILANNSLLLAQPNKTVAEQRQWVDSTQTEAQRMDALVRDLLLLAQTDDEERHTGAGTGTGASAGTGAGTGAGKKGDKKQGNKGGTRFSPCDLSALVRRNLLQFEAVFFERGVTLKADIANDITIEGDDEQLNRLVQILLDNASKYAHATVTECAQDGAEGVRKPTGGLGTGDGSCVPNSGTHEPSPVPDFAGGLPDYSPPCTVTLRTEAGAVGKRQRALLEVANSGDPIPPEALPHLFERFYRADNAHSDAEGSGLGLSLAQAIVTAHHGSIEVHSDAEHGTVFTVAL